MFSSRNVKIYYNKPNYLYRNQVHKNRCGRKIGNLAFVWKLLSSELDQAKKYSTTSEINKMIPTFESREMSKIFREKYAKIAVITPSYPSKHGGISDWPHSSASFIQLQVF